MGAFPSDPDGSPTLTPYERRVLAHVCDGVLRLPRWMIGMGPAALILVPLVLLGPVAWWIGIAAAIVVLGFRRRAAEGRS
jgi:hypothetical protein